MRPGPPSAKLRVAGLLATLACMAAIAPAAMPIAAAASTGFSPAASAQPGELARIAAYWTPERMRSTPPLDAAQGPLEALATASFTPVAEPSVPPFAANGRLFVRQGGERGFCSAT